MSWACFFYPSSFIKVNSHLTSEKILNPKVYFTVNLKMSVSCLSFSLHTACLVQVSRSPRVPWVWQQSEAFSFIYLCRSQYDKCLKFYWFCQATCLICPQFLKAFSNHNIKSYKLVKSLLKRCLCVFHSSGFMTVNARSPLVASLDLECDLFFLFQLIADQMHFGLIADSLLRFF